MPMPPTISETEAATASISGMMATVLSLSERVRNQTRIQASRTSLRLGTS